VSTVGELLHASPLPPLEARMLVQQVTGLTREKIATYPETVLDALQVAELTALFARRQQGEPVAYLTGKREFYGRSFAVTPAVLIPRPETEHLVDLALEVLAERANHNPRVLDLGSGSGVLAVTIALEHRAAQVTAIDVSDAALALARANAQALGATVNFLHSDWFSALRDARFDLIVSNPPYIAETDAHLSQGDLRFEPRQALASGAQGLDAIAHIAAQAAKHLEPGGMLAFEHGFSQGEDARRALTINGFQGVASRLDLAGHERLSYGLRSVIS
jgi:release factor glutamine methyltransferase